MSTISEDDGSGSAGSSETETRQANAFSQRFPKWREYLDPRFLGAVSVPGVLKFTQPSQTTCWSNDNQVGLITDGGGITVVDFVHTFEEFEYGVKQFIGSETNASCIKPMKDKNLENYVGIPLTTILQNRNKHDIFELVRDSIICPKELLNAETHLYYTKVEWSPHPLKLTTSQTKADSQYVLGALDSHFNFRIFRKPQMTQTKTGGVIKEDDWEVFVDLTESYRNLLLSQFWQINVDDETTFSANSNHEYKRRMYELATVNFRWLPQWDEDNDFSSDNSVTAGLVTAHASGDICIWHLCASPVEIVPGDPGSQKLLYFLTLEYRHTLAEREIISSLDFHKMSPGLGLLIVGTTAGSVKLFQVNYNSSAALALKPVPNDEGPQPQKYSVEEEILICDKDSLEIQCTLVVLDEDISTRKCGITLYVFKQPNFMLSVQLERTIGGEVRLRQRRTLVRIVRGTLTGSKIFMDQDSGATVLLAVTQKGMLSWIHLEDGEVRQVASYDLGAAEEVSGSNSAKDQTPSWYRKIKKRLQFGDLTVSPNRAMICVSKTLAEHYDHLELRSPSVLQFHSLLPPSNVWHFVHSACVANQFQLQKMGDVLTAYRVLMSFADSYLKEVLDWAVPIKSKSMKDLQILLWILRIQPRVDKDQLALAYNLRKEEPQTFIQLKYKQIRAIRRETLVSDRIMQLHCLNLVRKVVQNPEQYDLKGSLLNLQSLLTMYSYLETKKFPLSGNEALPLKPRVLENPPPRQPPCSLCGKPTKLMDMPSVKRRWEEESDYIVEHLIDEEKIEGVLWHEQQHVKKSRSHPISNCILSLVPVSFPYRKCFHCGTIAMQNPAFEQMPKCPFCNGVMEIPSEYYEDDAAELEEVSADIENLLKDIENEQAQLAAQKLKTLPMSRKARIEKMYVD